MRSAALMLVGGSFVAAAVAAREPVEAPMPDRNVATFAVVGGTWIELPEKRWHGPVPADLAVIEVPQADPTDLERFRRREAARRHLEASLLRAVYVEFD